MFMNSLSRVKILQSVNYPYRPPRILECKLDQIAQLDNYLPVNVHVHILSEGDIQFGKKKQEPDLPLQEKKVADDTNTILKLSAWGQKTIDGLQVGKTYIIKKTIVREYFSEKFLSTNQSTTFHEAPALPNIPNIEHETPPVHSIKASIVTANISKHLHCLMCKNITDIKQNLPYMIKCQKCNTAQKTSMMSISFRGMISFKPVDDTNFLKAICTTSALNDFINQLSLPMYNLPPWNPLVIFRSDQIEHVYLYNNVPHAL